MLFIPGKQDMDDCHFLLCNFPQYGYILFFIVRKLKLMVWNRATNPAWAADSEPPTILFQISEKYGFPEENIYKVYKKCKRG